SVGLPPHPRVAYLFLVRCKSLTAALQVEYIVSLNGFEHFADLRSGSIHVRIRTAYSSGENRAAVYGEVLHHGGDWARNASAGSRVRGGRRSVTRGRDGWTRRSRLRSGS